MPTHHPQRPSSSRPASSASQRRSYTPAGATSGRNSAASQRDAEATARQQRQKGNYLRSSSSASQQRAAASGGGLHRQQQLTSPRPPEKLIADRYVMSTGERGKRFGVAMASGLSTANTATNPNATSGAPSPSSGGAVLSNTSNTLGVMPSAVPRGNRAHEILHNPFQPEVDPMTADSLLKIRKMIRTLDTDMEKRPHAWDRRSTAFSDDANDANTHGEARGRVSPSSASGAPVGGAGGTRQRTPVATLSASAVVDIEGGDGEDMATYAKNVGTEAGKARRIRIEDMLSTREQRRLQLLAGQEAQNSFWSGVPAIEQQQNSRSHSPGSHAHDDDGGEADVLAQAAMREAMEEPVLYGVKCATNVAGAPASVERADDDKVALTVEDIQARRREILFGSVSKPSEDGDVNVSDEDEKARKKSSETTKKEGGDLELFSVDTRLLKHKQVESERNREVESLVAEELAAAAAIQQQQQDAEEEAAAIAEQEQEHSTTAKSSGSPPSSGSKPAPLVVSTTTVSPHARLMLRAGGLSPNGASKHQTAFAKAVSSLADNVADAQGILEKTVFNAECLETAVMNNILKHCEGYESPQHSSDDDDDDAGRSSGDDDGEGNLGGRNANNRRSMLSATTSKQLDFGVDLEATATPSTSKAKKKQLKKAPGVSTAAAASSVTQQPADKQVGDNKNKKLLGRLVGESLTVHLSALLTRLHEAFTILNSFASNLNTLDDEIVRRDDSVGALEGRMRAQKEAMIALQVERDELRNEVLQHRVALRFRHLVKKAREKRRALYGDPSSTTAIGGIGKTGAGGEMTSGASGESPTTSFGQQQSIHFSSGMQQHNSRRVSLQGGGMMSKNFSITSGSGESDAGFFRGTSPDNTGDGGNSNLALSPSSASGFEGDIVSATIVHISIADYAALWELVPTAMAAGVELFNEVVRRVMASSVMTSPDGVTLVHRSDGSLPFANSGGYHLFLFRDAAEAVSFASSLHYALLLAPWPSNLLVSRTYMRRKHRFSNRAFTSAVASMSDVEIPSKHIETIFVSDLQASIGGSGTTAFRDADSATKQVVKYCEEFQRSLGVSEQAAGHPFSYNTAIDAATKASKRFGIGLQHLEELRLQGTLFRGLRAKIGIHTGVVFVEGSLFRYSGGGGATGGGGVSNDSMTGPPDHQHHPGAGGDVGGGSVHFAPGTATPAAEHNQGGKMQQQTNTPPPPLVYGSAIMKASLLCKAAQGGETLVSSAANQLASDFIAESGLFRVPISFMQRDVATSADVASGRKLPLFDPSESVFEILPPRLLQRALVFAASAAGIGVYQSTNENNDMDGDALLAGGVGDVEIDDGSRERDLYNTTWWVPFNPAPTLSTVFQRRGEAPLDLAASDFRPASSLRRHHSNAETQQLGVPEDGPRIGVSVADNGDDDDMLLNDEDDDQGIQVKIPKLGGTQRPGGGDDGDDTDLDEDDLDFPAAAATGDISRRKVLTVVDTSHMSSVCAVQTLSEQVAAADSRIRHLSRALAVAHRRTSLREAVSSAAETRLMQIHDEAPTKQFIDLLESRESSSLKEMDKLLSDIRGVAADASARGKLRSYTRELVVANSDTIDLLKSLATTVVTMMPSSAATVSPAVAALMSQQHPASDVVQLYNGTTGGLSFPSAVLLRIVYHRVRSKVLLLEPCSDEGDGTSSPPQFAPLDPTASSSSGSLSRPPLISAIILELSGQFDVFRLLSSAIHKFAESHHKHYCAALASSSASFSPMSLSSGPSMVLDRIVIEAAAALHVAQFAAETFPTLHPPAASAAGDDTRKTGKSKKSTIIGVGGDVFCLIGQYNAWTRLQLDKTSAASSASSSIAHWFALPSSLQSEGEGQSAAAATAELLAAMLGGFLLSEDDWVAEHGSLVVSITNSSGTTSAGGVGKNKKRQGKTTGGNLAALCQAVCCNVAARAASVDVNAAMQVLAGGGQSTGPSDGGAAVLSGNTMTMAASSSSSPSRKAQQQSAAALRAELLSPSAGSTKKSSEATPLSKRTQHQQGGEQGSEQEQEAEPELSKVHRRYHSMALEWRVALDRATTVDITTLSSSTAASTASAPSLGHNHTHRTVSIDVLHDVSHAKSAVAGIGLFLSPQAASGLGEAVVAISGDVARKSLHLIGAAVCTQPGHRAGAAGAGAGTSPEASATTARGTSSSALEQHCLVFPTPPLESISLAAAMTLQRQQHPTASPSSSSSGSGKEMRIGHGWDVCHLVSWFSCALDALSALHRSGCAHGYVAPSFLRLACSRRHHHYGYNRRPVQGTTDDHEEKTEDGVYEEEVVSLESSCALVDCGALGLHSAVQRGLAAEARRQLQLARQHQQREEEEEHRRVQQDQEFATTNDDEPVVGSLGATTGTSSTEQPTSSEAAAHTPAKDVASGSAAVNFIELLEPLAPEVLLLVANAASDAEATRALWQHAERCSSYSSASSSSTAAGGGAKKQRKNSSATTVGDDGGSTSAGGKNAAAGGVVKQLSQKALLMQFTSDSDEEDNSDDDYDANATTFTSSRGSAVISFADGGPEGGSMKQRAAADTKVMSDMWSLGVVLMRSLCSGATFYDYRISSRARSLAQGQLRRAARVLVAALFFSPAEVERVAEDPTAAYPDVLCEMCDCDIADITPADGGGGGGAPSSMRSATAKRKSAAKQKEKKQEDINKQQTTPTDEDVEVPLRQENTAECLDATMATARLAGTTPNTAKPSDSSAAAADPEGDNASDEDTDGDSADDNEQQQEIRICITLRALLRGYKAHKKSQHEMMMMNKSKKTATAQGAHQHQHHADAPDEDSVTAMLSGGGRATPLFNRRCDTAKGMRLASLTPAALRNQQHCAPALLDAMLLHLHSSSGSTTGVSGADEPSSPSSAVDPINVDVDTTSAAAVSQSLLLVHFIDLLHALLEVDPRRRPTSSSLLSPAASSSSFGGMQQHPLLSIVPKQMSSISVGGGLQLPVFLAPHFECLRTETRNPDAAKLFRIAANSCGKSSANFTLEEQHQQGDAEDDDEDGGGGEGSATLSSAIMSLTQKRRQLREKLARNGGADVGLTVLSDATVAKSVLPSFTPSSPASPHQQQELDRLSSSAGRSSQFAQFLSRRCVQVFLIVPEGFLLGPLEPFSSAVISGSGTYPSGGAGGAGVKAASTAPAAAVASASSAMGGRQPSSAALKSTARSSANLSLGGRSASVSGSDAHLLAPRNVPRAELGDSVGVRLVSIDSDVHFRTLVRSAFAMAHSDERTLGGGVYGEDYPAASPGRSILSQSPADDPASPAKRQTSNNGGGSGSKSGGGGGAVLIGTSIAPHSVWRFLEKLAASSSEEQKKHFA